MITNSSNHATCVLLVEDDEADALLFQRSLATLTNNYHSHVCSTLSDALCWLEDNHCDVVLLDLSLPDNFGLDGICKIHSRFADLPIVMLTGLDDDKTALNALNQGAQDYLVKGETSRRELEKTLRYAIQRQQILNENRALMRKLEVAARSDALTGVLNRHAMIEVFQKHWVDSCSTGRPLSCVIIDIDYFKRINDQYGHLGGDEVLRKVAKLIQEKTREGDFVARYGGEEFCVILADASEQQAIAWAEQMRSALASRPVELSGEQVSVTASFGVAQRTVNIESIEELVDLADQSLMLAKSNGRDQVNAPSTSMMSDGQSNTSLSATTQLAT